MVGARIDGLNSLRISADWVHVPLESRVTAKEYFVLKKQDGAETSRPINKNLFDPECTLDHLESVKRGGTGTIEPKEALDRVLYTIATAYCGVIDVRSRNSNKKSPARFFEILAGHLVAQAYDKNPDTKIPVLNLDLQTDLHTDYVFDFGAGKAKLHLPVKTSTRERIIQAWAHQRLLDGVYGASRFRGVLVCLAETNKQTRTNSVVEVCLPGQWALYQMFISQLWRIYYFDLPDRYAEISTSYPFIQVKKFTEFFRVRTVSISSSNNTRLPLSAMARTHSSTPCGRPSSSSACRCKAESVSVGSASAFLL